MDERSSSHSSPPVHLALSRMPAAKHRLPANLALRGPPTCPQVLSDDEKRGIYDRFGEQGLKGGFAGAGAGGMGGMGDFR